jgi:hypothetical protein
VPCMLACMFGYFKKGGILQKIIGCTNNELRLFLKPRKKPSFNRGSGAETVTGCSKSGWPMKRPLFPFLTATLANTNQSPWALGVLAIFP